MEFLTYLLSFLNHNGLWIGMVLIVLSSFSLAPVLLLYGLKAGLLEFSILFTLGMFIMFTSLFGKGGNKLINKYGETGTGKIISVNATNMYIGRHGYYTTVYKYKVLLRTAKGKTIETSFKDYKARIVVTTKRYVPPSVRLSVYKKMPEVNVEFPVKYLKRHPRMFIIQQEISDQQIQDLTCAPLKSKLMEAKAKLDFDPANYTYKQEVADLMEAYFLRNGCDNISDSTNLNIIRAEIMRLRASQ